VRNENLGLEHNGLVEQKASNKIKGKKHHPGNPPAEETSPGCSGTLGNETGDDCCTEGSFKKNGQGSVARNPALYQSTGNPCPEVPSHRELSVFKRKVGKL